MREWIVDGRAHNVTGCGRCGRAIDPGGKDPHAVPVEDDTPLCGDCLAQGLGIVGVIGGRFEFIPNMWAEQVCQCDPCIEQIDRDADAFEKGDDPPVHPSLLN